MTDEEKKAIELLKKLQKTKPYIIWGDGETPYNKSNMISTILELIEKQAKEIKESEQKEKQAYIDGTNIADKLCNKKWEDKIKAKIEELEEAYEDNYIIKILQSLLEKE